MEYFPTDLPKYWPIMSRENFSNAVVKEGYVLVFTQDGQTLTAKTSSGDFISISSDSFDFSATTALPADVLAQKYFYNASGELVQGTMESLSSNSYTPGTTDQTIFAGKYLAGNQKIKGDVNLISGNIKEGVTIFGIIGSLPQGIRIVSQMPTPTADIVGKVYMYTGTTTSSFIQGHTYLCDNLGEDYVNISGFGAGRFTSNLDAHYYENGEYGGYAKYTATSNGCDLKRDTSSWAIRTIDGGILQAYGPSLTSSQGWKYQNGSAVSSSAVVELVEGQPWVDITPSSGANLRAGVIVGEGDDLKIQPLSFEGTVPSDSGASQSFSSLYSFNTGHPEPGGVTPAPVPETSMDFYKCTYVSSDSSMLWKGKKAVLNEGLYSLQSNSTEGLTYTDIVPVIDQLYSNDALVHVSYLNGLPPADGLIRYLPLDIDTNDRLGTTVSKTGTVSLSTVDNIPCGTMTAGNYLITSNFKLSQFTISAWLKGQESSRALVTISRAPEQGGYGSGGSELWMTAYPNRINFGNGGTGGTLYDDTSAAEGWHHLAATWTADSKLNLYVDGVIAVANISGYAFSNIYLWCSINTLKRYPAGATGNGSYAGVRLYNRALSAREIWYLFNEFTPTAS